MTLDAIADALAQGKRSKGVPVNSEDDVVMHQRQFLRWLRGAH